jgi:hypothetical protein
LAYITGMVNQHLFVQCEYLLAENRILRSQLPTRLRLSDAQRSTLAEIGQRLGRKYLAEVAFLAKPATIPGTGASLHRNSMAPSGVPIPDDHAFLPIWHARTLGGVMTGSLAPWPTIRTLADDVIPPRFRPVRNAEDHIALSPKGLHDNATQSDVDDGDAAAAGRSESETLVARLIQFDRRDFELLFGRSRQMTKLLPCWAKAEGAIRNPDRWSSECRPVPR